MYTHENNEQDETKMADHSFFFSFIFYCSNEYIAAEQRIIGEEENNAIGEIQGHCVLRCERE